MGVSFSEGVLFVSFPMKFFTSEIRDFLVFLGFEYLTVQEGELVWVKSLKD